MKAKKKKQNPDHALTILNYKQVQRSAQNDFASANCETSFRVGYIKTGGRGNFAEVRLQFIEVEGMPEETPIINNAKTVEIIHS